MEFAAGHETQGKTEKPLFKCGSSPGFLAGRGQRSRCSAPPGKEREVTIMSELLLSCHQKVELQPANITGFSLRGKFCSPFPLPANHAVAVFGNISGEITQ
jgi:hypothetical protein